MSAVEAQPRLTRARIAAVELFLIGDRDRVVGRGVVPIDLDEGPPSVICWNGETFLRVAGLLIYQKTRVLHADARFEAVP